MDLRHFVGLAGRYGGLYFRGLADAASFPLKLGQPSRRRAYAEYLKTSRIPIPEISIERLLPTDADCDLTIQLKGLPPWAHDCNAFELCVLAISVKITHATRIYEIGTWHGQPSLTMAANLPEHGRIYTLNLPPDVRRRYPAYDGRVSTQGLPAHVDFDPWSLGDGEADLCPDGERLRGEPEENKVVKCYGNSMTYDASLHAPYQIVRLDGGKCAEIVEHDASEAFRLVDCSNGIILWNGVSAYTDLARVLARMKVAGHRIYRIKGTDIAFVRYFNGEQSDLGR